MLEQSPSQTEKDIMIHEQINAETFDKTLIQYETAGTLIRALIVREYST